MGSQASGFEAGYLLVLDDSQIVVKWSQFAVKSMLGVIDLETVLEDQFCFLGGSAQFRMLIDIAGSQDGAGQPLQRVFQFGDALHDVGGRSLRLDVAIECDLAFDFLDVLGDGGFAVLYFMDGPRNDACQWIGGRHGTDYRSKIR